MAIVNYMVNFTVSDGTSIAGGFSVDYADPSNPILTGINLTDSHGGSITNINPPGGFVTIWASPTQDEFQLQYSTGMMSPDGVYIEYTDALYDGNSATLVDMGGATQYSLNGFGGMYTAPGGTIVSTPSLACFLEGTNIETACGAVAIENLSIGDQILTEDGREVAVKWVGHQQIHPAFAKMLDSMPVCICAGALGNGLPKRDLYVSPDHAMFVDGALLVHAKALVNGITIYQPVQWQGNIKYLHIETEAHEIILAEGAPAETFIDNVSRKLFNNHAEYTALYPDANPMTELAVPRVKYARQLPQAIKNNLLTLAHAISPTAQRAF